MSDKEYVLFVCICIWSSEAN